MIEPIGVREREFPFMMNKECRSLAIYKKDNGGTRREESYQNGLNYTKTLKDEHKWIRHEQREDECHSDWLKSFEQREAVPIFGIRWLPDI